MSDRMLLRFEVRHFEGIWNVYQIGLEESWIAGFRFKYDAERFAASMRELTA